MQITNSDKSSSKPAILIDAGIHAREWIAPATALYFINQLVEEESNQKMLDVDWYIIPLMNPDGYDYSQKQVSIKYTDIFHLDLVSKN